jgi:hypothetical protein
MGGTCSWGAHLPACQNPTLSVKHLCQASSVAPPYRTNFAAAIAGLATSGREDCIYINELEAGLIREQLMPVLRACRSLVRMGGTGLEPVTPSLSSWQRAICRLAFFDIYYTICSIFAPSRRPALARVCTLSHELVVARGSTVGV